MHRAALPTEIGARASLRKPDYFAENFAELRGDRSLQTLSDEIFARLGVRITPQAMHKWLRGGNIAPANVRVLSTFFGVSEAWLMHGSGSRGGVTLEQMVNALSPESAKLVLGLLRYSLEQCDPPPAPELLANYRSAINALLKAVDSPKPADSKTKT